MSAPAIIMMILSIMLLWGGLTVAIINLLRFRGPEPDETFRDL